MTNTIQLKHSVTTGNAPSSLAVGEVAINEADRILYYRNPSGVIVPTYLDGNGSPNLVQDADMIYGGGVQPGYGASPWSLGVNGWSPWFWNRNFILWNNTNQTVSVSVVDGPFKMTKALRFNWASQPSSGEMWVFGPQWRDDGIFFQNGRLSSMSHYFRSDNLCDVQADVRQNFGTGGSATVTTTFYDESNNGGAGWLRHAATVLVPSIAGKTIGTDPLMDIQVQFLPRATGNYDYACPQFQDGPISDYKVGTPFFGLANAQVVIPNQASPTFDAQSGRTRYALLVATANRTLAIPTGSPKEGQSVRIAHYASGGARTLALTTGSTGAFDLGAISLSQTLSGVTDIIDVLWNPWFARWMVVGYKKGYPAA